jgi:ankyrin repeat protein
LLEAAEKGNLKYVRELLDDGVDVNSRNKYGESALTKSAEQGRLDLAKFLLERGAYVNAV